MTYTHRLTYIQKHYRGSTPTPPLRAPDTDRRPDKWYEIVLTSLGVSRKKPDKKPDRK